MRTPIHLPDLGAGRVVLSVWFADVGDTVYEGDRLVEIRPSNFVAGTARLDGRRVVLGGDDFTVRGGAADGAVGYKAGYAERMALEQRLPIVRLVDGTGGGGSVKSLETTRRTYVPANPAMEIMTELLSTVPVVAAALGPVAGLGAARVVFSHFSVMPRGTAQLFVAGPPVVRRGIGQDVDKETLGGSRFAELVNFPPRQGTLTDLLAEDRARLRAALAP